MNKVTEYMKLAGNDIAKQLFTASIYKTTNEGFNPNNNWMDDTTQNKDLVLQYLDNTIDSVTAIYIAMERARLEK